MKKIYNVGDRCLIGNSPCEILSIHKPDKRFKIRYLNVNNVKGNNVTSWVHYSDIELDREYYRDLKIKILLDI